MVATTKTHVTTTSFLRSFSHILAFVEETIMVKCHVNSQLRVKSETREMGGEKNENMFTGREVEICVRERCQNCETLRLQTVKGGILT